MKQNLHTHTRFDDGKGSVDEIVQKAIELGFTDLGFSGHSYNTVDDAAMSRESTEEYVQDVLAAKKKYKDRIHIYLGLELDSLTSEPGFIPEYQIGSVHFLIRDGKAFPIDYDEEQFVKLLSTYPSVQEMAKDYFKEVGKIAKNPDINIVGHLDLIAKYNEDEKYYRFDDPQIQKSAFRAIDDLIRAGKIFEMNTGAMSRGYRSDPYPHMNLLRYIVDHGGKIMINSDSHYKDNLDFGFEKAFAVARNSGVKKLVHFNGKDFEEVEIDQWQ